MGQKWKFAIVSPQLLLTTRYWKCKPSRGSGANLMLKRNGAKMIVEDTDFF